MRVTHMSHWGFVDIYTKRAEEGIAECEHGVSAGSKSCHTPMPMIGVGKNFIGRAEEAEAHIARGLAHQSARYDGGNWMDIAGSREALPRQWEQAVAWFRRAIEANRNDPKHISGWPPRWRNSADLTRRVSRSRQVSRSTRPSRSPAHAPPGRRLSTTPPIWPNSSPFSKACARPGSPNNDPDPPPRRDPRRRPRRLFAPHGRGRAGTAKAVRERLRRQPIVANLGGRIVKTTGDGSSWSFLCGRAVNGRSDQKLMTERNAEPRRTSDPHRIGMNLDFAPVRATTMRLRPDRSAARRPASPGAFMFQAPPTTMFAGVSTPPSPISARRTS